MQIIGNIRRAFNALLGRNFDAAGAGRRWNTFPAAINAGTIAAQAGTLSQRASNFALNTSLGSKIVETLIAHIVGDGIKSRSLHPSETVRKRLHRDFAAWTDEADFDGLSDFFGLQQLAVRDLVIHGEALFYLTDTGGRKLRRLHPDQLDRAKTVTGVNGAQVWQGVEFGPDGRRTAYWIMDHVPGSSLLPQSMVSRRYPASEIIHVFRPLIAGQVRGLSWFAPVLLPAKELDGLLDALITRAKVAALFAGVVHDADGGGILDGEQNGSAIEASLEPGAMIHLPPGKHVEFPSMPDCGPASPLAVSMLRQISAGAGITYEQLSGDYSQVNYSSARAALLEFRRFIAGVQHHTMVFQFCRPVWARFIRSQMLTGGLLASAPRGDRAAKWLPPSWSSVDPAKDAKAAETELRNNLRSRSEIIAERGYDSEEVDAEIAADRARAERLGIAPAPSTPAPKTEAPADAR
jgi:lambda family phage portal protein